MKTRYNRTDRYRQPASAAADGANEWVQLRHVCTWAAQIYCWPTYSVYTALPRRIPATVISSLIYAPRPTIATHLHSCHIRRHTTYPQHCYSCTLPHPGCCCTPIPLLAALEPAQSTRFAPGVGAIDIISVQGGIVGERGVLARKPRVACLVGGLVPALPAQTPAQGHA